MLKESSKVANTFHSVLSPMIVAAEYRGRGCGKVLLQWGREYAKEHGLQCYLLAVPDAVGFYRKNGFESFRSSGGNLARDSDGGGDARPLENTLMRMIWSD